MAHQPHEIAACEGPGAPPTLLDIRFMQHTLAYLGGVSDPTSRAWIDRYHVLTTSASERGKGYGGPRLYSFSDALVFSAVRALVDDACLTIATASKMVGQSGHVLSDALLRGRDLHYSQRRGQILGFDYSKADPLTDCGARALITIRPNQVWLEMRPRFLEAFPEETAEFERKLAELRERLQRERGGDE